MSSRIFWYSCTGWNPKRFFMGIYFMQNGIIPARLALLRDALSASFSAFRWVRMLTVPRKNDESLASLFKHPVSLLLPRSVLWLKLPSQRPRCFCKRAKTGGWVCSSTNRFFGLLLVHAVLIFTCSAARFMGDRQVRLPWTSMAGAINQGLPMHLGCKTRRFFGCANR